MFCWFLVVIVLLISLFFIYLVVLFFCFALVLFDLSFIVCVCLDYLDIWWYFYILLWSVVSSCVVNSVVCFYFFYLWCWLSGFCYDCGFVWYFFVWVWLFTCFGWLFWFRYCLLFVVGLFVCVCDELLVLLVDCLIIGNSVVIVIC